MQPTTALARRLAGRQPTEWQKDAACRDLDPDLFFPEGTLGSAWLQAQEAKRVCGGCPVRAPCLRWALVTGQDAGIWGGTTEEERRRLARSCLPIQARPPGRETAAGHRVSRAPA